MDSTHGIGILLVMSKKHGSESSSSQRIAFSYIRWSSDRQTAGDSLRRQTEMAERICMEKGWTLDTSLAPAAGVSSFKGDNLFEGSLKKFRDLAAAGKLPKNPILIIERLDRFSRAGIKVALPIFTALLDAGVSVYSCADGQFYEPSDSDDMPKMVSLVIGLSNAADYVRNLSTRIKASRTARNAKIAKGEIVNVKDIAPKWLEWNGSEYVPNQKADTVKRIFSEYASGKSINEIARILDNEKVPTFLGAIGWQTSTVACILRNSAATGLFRGNPGFFPTVVEKELFDSVQNLLTANSKKSGHRSPSVNLFKGMIKCTCGSSAFLGGNGSGLKIYRCSAAAHGKCDHKQHINVGSLELDFFGQVLQEHPSILINKHDTTIQRQVTEAQKTIAQAEKKIEDARKLIGLVQVEELAADLNRFQNERKTAQEALDNLNRQMLLDNQSPHVLGEIRSILNTLKALPPIKIVSENGEIDGLTISQEQTDAIDAFVKQTEAMLEQLKNKETRQKLAMLIPSLIGGLVIDFENGKYAVKSHSGELSEWRKIRQTGKVVGTFDHVASDRPIELVEV